MKVGFVIGCKFVGLAPRLYQWMIDGGHRPDFVLCTLPGGPDETYSAIEEEIVTAPSINSPQGRALLARRAPRCSIVYGCGIVDRTTCERFHNALINVHAGQLPEFRGINNVEWAYFEDKPLVGTVHFIRHRVDSGDVIVERELAKLESARDIEEVRMHAFEQSYRLVPEALDIIERGDTLPRVQEQGERTNRYLMHPFLKDVLARRLGG